jgi:hypothetical protein
MVGCSIEGRPEQGQGYIPPSGKLVLTVVLAPPGGNQPDSNQ